MSSLSSPLEAAWPAVSESLEEVCAARPWDVPAALTFALGRLPDEDRPWLMATTPARLREQGRPCGARLRSWGEATGRLIYVIGRTEAETLWAMEQALRSGAVRAVVGAVEGATLAQTRRLDFAARDGEAVCILLRQTEGGLNAARRRWRITSAPSLTCDLDPRAPGLSRLNAELVRSRVERPGTWMLEQDDETHRLRLADRLAGDGLVERGPARLGLG